MITDIESRQMAASSGSLITPFRSVRWQSGRPGAGCLLLALATAVRRCRYPIPANGARHGTVDAGPGRGAALSMRRAFRGYRLGEKRRVRGTAEEDGSGRCGTGRHGSRSTCASSCDRHVSLGLQGSERRGARASRVSRRSGSGSSEAPGRSRSRSAGKRGRTVASSELAQEGIGDGQPRLVR